MPLADVYLEFLGGRCRPNTVRAAAYDLKVFFTSVAKPPDQVRPADVLAFITAQRTGQAGEGGVLQPVTTRDEPGGVSAATVRRRLSIVLGFFAFLQARGDVSRFPSRDHFASCNGTAPIEVSSGGRKICRLSRRGNRRLDHAIHMAAVTQVRHPHSKGRACYDKKLAEGKTRKEALRALKRQVSDAIYTALQADAARAAARSALGEPGRATGERLTSQRGRLHPHRRLFGQATPGPATSLRPRQPRRQIPLLPFPAPPPPRASGQAGPGPGAARPRSQCHVVSPACWLSICIDHGRATGCALPGECGGAPVDQGIATSPLIVDRSSVE